MHHISKNTKKVAYFILTAMVILLAYVVYLQAVRGYELSTHALNKRSTQLSQRVARGNIQDKNGAVLASSERTSDHTYVRHYPYGPIAAFITGYYSAKLGKTAIESRYDGYLSGMVSPERHWGALSNLLAGSEGNTVWTTIDAGLQNEAYRALGSHRGAVIVLDPRSGAILAMVSKPGFDPNGIEKQWDTISKAENGMLLNRVVQGLYPPGSIMKIVVAEAALSNKVADLKTDFVCEGSLSIPPDYVLYESNHQVHGKLHLQEALAYSCNVTFGSLALKLGRTRMAKTFERYGFHRNLTELDQGKSHLPEFQQLGDGDLAQTGIGQGPLLVTPLHMVMATAAIANHGVTMKPYLVSKVTSPQQEIRFEHKNEVWAKVTTKDIAMQVNGMMVAAVEKGTASRARISSVKVAGKTGTAENPHGASHAWFVGFAPADDPRIAIAVIAENAGAGGTVATPIARQVILQALK
ncbi:peptidoglycan D,D-transpeptidase FtsI family protein [Acetonema longum]|uniref:Peptidoglycan glycosyltransferase n=1 Tax=Acetonema longum DSM 6540 TaxID=1009370 RepID=F7NLF2_9FIRM|nr:penicillin-binding transpeptidase domain-containing protein [Acetonema longum]EGO63257.1 peptidoglycan glycosyltransferase [Acetonema longum DSM 6540]